MLETGPLTLETGPLVESGPLKLEQGPLRREPGPLELEPGPLTLETGPLRREPGPLRLESGPLRLEPGPLRLEPGPLRLKPGPLRLEPGPLRRETELSGFIKVVCRLALTIWSYWHGCREQVFLNISNASNSMETLYISHISMPPIRNLPRRVIDAPPKSFHITINNNCQQEHR